MSDPPTLNNLETLTVLLRQFHWSVSAGEVGRYEVWSPESDSDDEIVVPLDPRRGDFVRLVDRALRTMLQKYGQPARDLIALLEVKTRAGLESTRWSKETTINAGLIEWEQGETLYKSVRTLLSVSAKSAKQPRSHHGKSSAYVAKRFLDGCLMGQTDIGSYVITAYTPSQQRFYVSRKAEESPASSAGMVELQSLTGSQILNTLENALDAVRSGLDEYRAAPNLEVFSETVARGVSSEFARALGDITRNGETSIEITRNGTGDQSTQSRREIVFQAPEAAVLDSVAVSLASDPEPVDVTLVGEVVVLDRSSADHDRVIRLRVKEGARVRSAKVRLTVDQYAMAMEAHGQDLDLRVSGRLEKDHNAYWLYNAAGLALVRQTPVIAGDQLPL